MSEVLWIVSANGVNGRHILRSFHWANDPPPHPPTATTVTAEQEMQPLGDVIEGDPTSDV